MPDLEPLKQLISKHESCGDYDIVYGRIPDWAKPVPYLGKKLTECRIEEVLAWQAFVTSESVGAVSSAAGKWQIIRKTLSTFYPAAGLNPADLFEASAQDRMFAVLLERRGYLDYLSGALSAESFANEIAREWAAMPVVTETDGAFRKVQPGECYYAGDGVNIALASPDEFMRAIRAIRA